MFTSHRFYSKLQTFIFNQVTRINVGSVRLCKPQICSNVSVCSCFNVSMWQHCVYGLLVTKTKPASVAQSRLETSLKLVRNSFLSRVSVTVSAGNIRLLIESLQFWSMVSSLCWHEIWIYLCFQHFNMSFLWRRLLLLHMFCFSDLHRDGELRPVPGEAGHSGLMVPGCPSICPEQLFRVRDPRQRAAVRVWREGGRDARGRPAALWEQSGPPDASSSARLTTQPANQSVFSPQCGFYLKSFPPVIVRLIANTKSQLPEKKLDGESHVFSGWMKAHHRHSLGLDHLHFWMFQPLVSSHSSV